jgi:hypothetical protein
LLNHNMVWQCNLGYNDSRFRRDRYLQCTGQYNYIQNMNILLQNMTIVIVKAIVYQYLQTGKKGYSISNSLWPYNSILGSILCTLCICWPILHFVYCLCYANHIMKWVYLLGQRTAM